MWCREGGSEEEAAMDLKFEIWREERERERDDDDDVRNRELRIRQSR